MDAEVIAVNWESVIPIAIAVATLALVLRRDHRTARKDVLEELRGDVESLERRMRDCETARETLIRRHEELISENLALMRRVLQRPDADRGA